MSLTSIPDPLWSAERVAEYFGVDKQTVVRWIQVPDADGVKLEGKKINNRWKIPQSAVHRYRDHKFAQGSSR